MGTHLLNNAHRYYEGICQKFEKVSKSAKKSVQIRTIMNCTRLHQKQEDPQKGGLFLRKFLVFILKKVKNQ